ncbi:hypothetical protein GMA11_01275 [Granulicatella sp. zg-ZJ]|uniref:hypothetical protein n=1 Tax=Granulicatella sp. zg-ZJ TaxID=2678504 RepID=UPI0013CFB721|nr:hypothetical protein [Granulicatella sp. zg-ZJ]NEW62015.1 hypothetical protein [Granulicatella sp. zg-ZJ]
MTIKSETELLAFFKKLKFKKKLFFGVDEKDVWRKLANLQQEYQTLIAIHDAKYEALLAERDNLINARRSHHDEKKEIY